MKTCSHMNSLAFEYRNKLGHKKNFGHFSLQDLNVVEFFDSCRVKLSFETNSMVLSISFLFVNPHIKNSSFKIFFTNWDMGAIQRVLEQHIPTFFIVQICSSLFALEKQTSKKADYASLITLSDVIPSEKFSYEESK